jgi:phosphocarrier protein HPr
MPSTICKVSNKKGMHARAAAKIVTLIGHYPQCKVTLGHNQVEAPGDSLLKLLTLNAPLGSTIKISIEGDKKLSAELLNKLSLLFAQGFGE